MKSLTAIARITICMFAALFFAGGAEELLRSDAASSDIAGFAMIILGSFAVILVRYIGNKDFSGANFVDEILKRNEVVLKLASTRIGRVSISMMIVGGVTSILSAIAIKMGIYSVVFLSGFGIILIGLALFLLCLIWSAVEVFRSYKN